MSKLLRLFTLLILGGTLITTSCKKDEETTVETPSEFIANDDSFTGFNSWTLVAEEQGPDPALGAAHAGNDSTVTRRVYFKDNANRVNGAYPLGTIIVKEGTNPDVSFQEITAMVKRGNNFNPAGGDWEWFMLAPDGGIAIDGDGNPVRGANLLGGMCLGCHSQASNLDYAFSKQ